MTDVAEIPVARRFWVLAALIAVLGTALSVWVWHQRATAESRSLEAEFRQEAETLYQAVDREIRLFLDVLDSIRILHTLSERISDEDFEEFVQKGMLHQQRILGAFGFIQRIPHENRAPLETAADPTGRPALTLLESDGHGGHVTAAEREEYFVLTYQTPPNGLGLPTGYDFLSWPSAARAIARMQVRDGPAVGGLATAGPSEVRPGWYVFSPIYYSGIDGVLFPPPGWLVGFVTAILRPADILARALGGVPEDRFFVELIEPGIARPVEGRLVHEVPIGVADQEWRFRCRAGPAFERSRGPRQSGLLLVVGLSLTGLLTWQLARAGSRTREIERTVQLRTMDLQAAHEQIEREMKERMRLEDEIHSLAAREQQRVGRDLHDSLGQKLTGALFLSRGLLRRLEQAAPAESDAARQLNETLKEAVAEVRRMARGLVPVAIGEDGLADALQRLAEESRQMYGIPCEFHLACGRPPDAAAAEQLYYIAREAVHNAVRHARPTRIQIALLETGGEWRLSVEDDGCGMPPETDRAGGMGLRIMRHRAASIGACIELETPAGGGTRVVCRPAS